MNFFFVYTRKNRRAEGKTMADFVVKFS